MGPQVPEPAAGRQWSESLRSLFAALAAALTADDIIGAVETGLSEFDGVTRVRVVRASSDGDADVAALAGSGGRLAQSGHDGPQLTLVLGAEDEPPLGVVVLDLAAGAADAAGLQARLDDVLVTCARALQRARRHDDEVAARRRAEYERGQLAFLAEVSNAVASSLATRELVERLCAVAVPRLGDWSTILLTDGVVLERVAGVHRDAARQHLVDRLVGSYPVPLAGSSPIARSYRTREAQVLPAVDRSVVTSIVDDATYIETVLELTSGGGMMVPLVVRGRSVGVIAFGLETDERGFGPDEVWLATELARRAALGIDNASKYEQEHGVAELLQQAVLPEELPTVSGLDLAARYLPAGPGVEVGGDWYDAFVLDDGSLGLVIGDVAGHDVEAAATMAQLRNALRAYAFEGGGPAAVLAQLNRLLCRTMDPLFATMVFAVVSPDRRSLTWANAGHPPCLVVKPDGPVLLHQPRGVLLGVRAGATYPEGRVELGPHDLLLLYTDGLVERRDDSLDAGIGRLSNRAARAATRGPGAAAVCERVLGSLLAGHLRTDDVCLLAMWAIDAAASFEFAVPADSFSSRMARTRVAEALAEWDVSELIDPVQLLVSELVTNAVIHVGAKVRVRVERLPLGVRVRVYDAGEDTVAARPRHVAPESPTGRGLLIVDNVADRWGVERTAKGKQVWFELSFEGAARRWGATRARRAT